MTLNVNVICSYWIYLRIYFTFSDAYYIPNLTLNFVSIGQLCDSGYSELFSSTNYYV